MSFRIRSTYSGRGAPDYVTHVANVAREARRALARVKSAAARKKFGGAARRIQSAWRKFSKRRVGFINRLEGARKRVGVWKTLMDTYGPAYNSGWNQLTNDPYNTGLNRYIEARAAKIAADVVPAIIESGVSSSVTTPPRKKHLN